MKNRNTTHGLVFILVLSMLASSSIVYAAEVTESLTCMNVDGSGVATGISTNFLTTTPKIYTKVTFSNLLPGQVITIGWEIPGGGSWDSTMITATSNTVYWHSIPIEGDPAATYKGTWTVNIYVDDELVDSINFKIIDYEAIVDSIVLLNGQIQAANDLAYEWQEEFEALETRTTAIEANYSSVLTQNLIIQSELNQKVLEFTVMEADYNALNLNYTETKQQLEEVKNDLNDLKNQSGDNTTLYLAIGAAVISLLAAGYFYMKSR